MKLRFAFLGLLSLLTVSCSYEESFVPEDDYDNSAVEFYATIDEQPDADTKVYADENLKVLWNADDRITIFNKIAYNQEYRFTGVDGDNSGTFKKVPNDDFATGTELERIYAVYPYRESTRISNSGIITTAIPSEQTYLANSFGRGANTMVASAGDNLLRFKNVGGYLSLKFYGEGVSVSSITLKSNNGEFIAGDCTIDMSSGLPVSNLITANASDAITMVCDPPIELPAEKAESAMAIFVLYPVTLTGGITVTVTTPDGEVLEKSTSNKLEIDRSSITKMGAMEVVPVLLGNIVFADPEVKMICVENWDQDGDGELSFEEAAEVSDLGVVFRSSSITSFDELAYFTGLKEIRTSAFYSCQNLKSIAIPKKVTTIKSEAFWHSGLDHIDLPGSLTTIEDSAFWGTGIKQVCIPESVISIGQGVFYGCDYLESFSGRYASADGHSLVMDGRLVASATKGLADSTYEIPSSVTTICKYSVSLVSLSGYPITGISIPEGVTKIEDDAISISVLTTTGIESISLPNSLVELGYSNFHSYKLSSFTGKFASSDGRCLVENGILKAFAPSGLTEYTIPQEVTQIGVRVFRGFNLSSIVIPDHVTDIMEDAFYNSSIIYITLPAELKSIGNYSFKRCSDLTEIVIPANVESIGWGAFSGCTGLTSITSLSPVPPKIKSDTFNKTRDCVIYVPSGSVDAYKSAQYWSSYADRIQAISLPSNAIFYTSTDGNIVTPYTEGAFGANIISNTYVNGRGKIIFDGELTAIGQSAFENCSTLATLSIPNTVTTIGEASFRGCSGLLSFTVPSSVSSIENYAFNGCSSITEVVLEDGTSVLSLGYNTYRSESWGKGLFRDCPITRLYLGRNMSYSSYSWYDSQWGFSPFANLPIEELRIGPDVTRITRQCFRSTSLKQVVIPSGVERIEEFAFMNCDLKSVQLPEGLTTIGGWAFYGAGFESISLPQSLTTIGARAFADNTSLSSISIPNSVTEIGIGGSGFNSEGKTFDGCTNLKRVVFEDGNKTLNYVNGYDLAGGAASREFRFVTYAYIGRNITYINWNVNPAGYLGSALFSVNLKDAFVSDSVTIVPDYFFCYCYGLETVSFGNSIRSINNSVFWEVPELKIITIHTVVPPVLNENQAIPDDCLFYVPSNSVSSYKSAETWSNYADRIQGIN